MTKTIIKTVRQSPWPGPRPYEMWEGELFFGRDSEIEELRRMILREQLTILSADSGAGKTSLLRAGLAYGLIKERQDDSRGLIKPVLLLRDWGGGKRENVEQLFNYELREAISNLSKENLPTQANNDFNLLSKVQLSDSDPFVGNIIKLCDQADGLILIFDQFEEVLRVGEETAKGAISLIKDIYRFEPRARIMLSLRSEYHRNLHELEVYVGGLYSRTYFLKLMVVSAAKEAVQKSAERAKVEIDKTIIDNIVTMLVEASNSDYKAQEKADAVDLLTLQAILPELFELSKLRQPDIEKVVIDNASYQDYRKNKNPKELVADALANWIERGLNQPFTKSSEHLTPAMSQILSDYPGIVHRIASRMAQYLSSGGYKVTAEETELMSRTLREDLMRLTPVFGDIEVSDLKVISNNPVCLDRSLLELEEPENVKFAVNNLSGISIEKQWTPADTADNLARAFYETLYRLHAANILKPIYKNVRVRWELIHDGMGKPFSAWSEKKRDTWDDCVYAFTASKGVDIKIPSKKDKKKMGLQKAVKVIWRGCFISARKEPVLEGDGSQVSEKQPVAPPFSLRVSHYILENHEFDGCDLKGTVFEGITFRGGKFLNCIMDGCLFINCRFEASADGAPFVFSGCRANAMTFLTPKQESESEAVPVISEMGSVNFFDCNFTQIRFSGIKLIGNVVFGKNTRLSLCHFIRIDGDQMDSGKVVFDGCKIYYTAWDRQSRRFLSFVDLADEIGNGVLEDAN
ncbi:MAG: hypothetical protein FD146_2054 [Anaerolineaceae bacterium]|nr:MAG: hypothetical protein FD146_2054 [Anaerolineaceae bacterium]